MSDTMQWLVPLLIAAVGAIAAVWRAHRGAIAAEAYAKGRADQLAEHNKQALTKLHERLDRMERRLDYHHEKLLAKGIITPTMTGIPDVD
jgi:hypothetical protein